MNAEQPYIDEEAEWIGDWPNPPPEKYGRSQYSTLADELKKNVRTRAISEGVAPSEYWKPITEAKELFDDLRHWMNYSDHMTEEQREAFDSQCYWYHKKLYEGGLTDRKQDVWPISRGELIQDTRRYLETPLMWSDNLDYLLTDALVYAETAAYRETLMGSTVLSWGLGGEAPWYLKLLGFLVKWALILGVLGASHEVSRELFLALSICVIAYQLRKSFYESPQAKKAALYADMVGMYNSCEHQYYNPSVIWDMCRVVRDKGAVYDGVLYDLLEKQCIQNNKRWTRGLTAERDA